MDNNEFNVFKNYYPSQDIDTTRFYDEEEEEEIKVVQNLTLEQVQYEFPLKQYLKELAYLDTIDSEYSFFDESSFMTVYSSVDQIIVKQDEECLVDDSRLSPLQLPAQVSHTSSPTIHTWIRPVGPSSFLSDHVIPTREKDDMESLSSSKSKVVLIQLNKSTLRSFSISDEGYDDTIEEKELESQCTFYPIKDDDEEQVLIRDGAAVKIQALWRGYRCRQTLKQPNPFVYNLAHAVHLRTVYKKIDRLEQQLRQETAMRMAFEKAMEDMTVLMDQQQKILYDRLEGEVHLRQMYESKLPQFEAKLKKEMNARSKLEEMMTRVLDQLHESETARIQQQEEFNKKIDRLTAIKSTTTNKPKTASHLTSKPIQERPSVIPSNRRRPLTKK